MKPFPTLSVGSINTALYTSPHATADLDPLPALLAIVNGAKVSILFSVYAFTLPTLAAAIIAKHKAGIAVQGVADSGEYGITNSQLPALAAAGINIRCWGDTYRLNHEKVFVIDGNIVALGSYNFTAQAEKENKEVLMIFTGKQVSKVLAPVLTAQIQASYTAGITPPATAPGVAKKLHEKFKRSGRLVGSQPPTTLRVGGEGTGINFSNLK